MTTEVVYNVSTGGFSISLEAWARMLALGYQGEASAYNKYVFLKDCARHNPILVQVVKELGTKKASGPGSDLYIAKVSGPYRIEEYDGWESVKEPDDYKWITP